VLEYSPTPLFLGRRAERKHSSQRGVLLPLAVCVPGCQRRKGILDKISSATRRRGEQMGGRRNMKQCHDSRTDIRMD
jgi:hypothetical protein